MKSLFYRLIIFLDTASEADTNYNIAWYMAHNFSKVAKMGISQLAKNVMYPRQRFHVFVVL